MSKDGFYKTLEWIKLRSKVKSQWLRDNKPCAYCGLPITVGQKSIADHVIPRRKDKSLELVITNIVMMHHECHTKKTFHVDLNDKVGVDINGYPPGWS